MKQARQVLRNFGVSDEEVTHLILYHYITSLCPGDAFSFYGILVVNSRNSGSKSPGAKPGWVIVWCSRARHYSLDRLGLGFL